MTEHCKGTTQFHKTEILLETAEIDHEYCKNCKEEVRFKKRKGRIDNESYGKWHKRDLLQPHNKYFEREYANA